jgi:hypothetical protein
VGKVTTPIPLLLISTRKEVVAVEVAVANQVAVAVVTLTTRRSL